MNRSGILFAIALLFVWGFYLNAQENINKVYVDSTGILRRSADNAELRGFGTNYTLPFAHEYRIAKKTGIPLEDLIREDVYHMARLDLDFYRVHVWDTEISDTLGNLIENEHLRLFDFALKEMKKRGIQFIITPIAWWGNGWPDKDEHTPGFSYKYGKDACLTNPAAIEAQVTYLFQFLNHVNPFTGIAYKNDPDIIGFEVCNEPHHAGEPEKVTAFINKMVTSMRKTGCTKPIFYNMSHSIALVDAYLNADVQGGTFQWYPANLVANHQINGNFLPHVLTYSIPFAEKPAFRKMAKIVYEFDAADVGGNIMYPAMALAFREAGMQLAAQFEYDALCGASYNSNYGTHFMNLAYAPHKAISLKIASAVFHQIPMYKFYPDQTHFEDFRISYTDDLTEWVTNEKFFYSNNTSSQPKDLALLKEIAGCGSSPLIQYQGTGAYFLDRINEGIWRLEVMPDAWWIDDPYSPVDLSRPKAAVSWNRRQMSIHIPDLGSDFSIQPVNRNNNFQPEASNGHFEIFPGVYLVRKKGITKPVAKDMQYKNIRLDEFVAPAASEGILKYIIEVEHNHDTTRQSAEVKLALPDSRLVLWNAASDWESSYKIWNRAVNLKSSGDGRKIVNIALSQLPAEDPVNQGNRSYSFKYYFGGKIAGRAAEIAHKQFLVLEASNNLNKDQPVEVGLVDINGSVAGCEFSVQPDQTIYKIPLDSLGTSSYLILPRPFPDFLPFKIPSGNKPFDLSSAETLQFMIKPGQQPNVDINIMSMWLE